ncbi:MAG: type I-C CRISPR-associated protein Cas5c [Coriobacteriia bacterium]|nr:type I-C CRISPR-associated protein Cas5c [Coriobacteriia bacterium]
MAYGFRVKAWGDMALFTRPELKVERYSYDVITPSAARGMLESVYWHPGMRYVIDRIHVLNPIEFTSVRRNEVKSKALASLLRSAAEGKKGLPHIYAAEDIQQRASVVLTNVCYVIEAHFEMTDDASKADNPGKFCDIFRRRLAKGQCYSQPYFGCREFAANLAPYEGQWPPQGAYSDVDERDLGFMLYDMDFSDPNDIEPMFFKAVMHNGVIDVAGSEVHR